MSISPPPIGVLQRLGASVADDVARHLRRLIVTGELPSGARLPAERALAAELGVSRTALREALRQLQSQGLVDSRHGSGTVVALERAASARMIAGLGRHERDVAASAELRALLEPKIAGLAAARAQKRHLAAMRRVLDTSAAVTDIETSMALDIEFHLAVADAAGNDLLRTVSQLTATWTVSERVHSHLDTRGRVVSHRGHRRIHAAIAAGDVLAAEQEMAVHLAEVAAIIDSSRAADAAHHVSP